MAGDWIKMRNDLQEDPAVIGMAAKLGIDEFAVVGRLHCLWAWADSQSRDGNAPGVTKSWIDRKLQRDGFAQAMCDVSWLEFTESGVNFPKFENHNGKSGKTRAMGTARQQNKRCRDADVPHSVTQTSRKQRDKSVTREEKRREEKEHPAGFVSFWSTWPASERKEAKGKCAEAWVKGNLEDIKDAILSHVEAKKQSPGWTKDGGQYIPAPLVYLNGRKWDGAEETGQVSLLSQFASRRVGA